MGITATLTTLYLLLTAPITITFFFVWAQDNCGSIGDSDETRATIETDEMFYLNTENPAPCTGNITSWRVCYYGPSDNLGFLQQRSYWATYAVYRVMGSGENERFERVSDMYSAVRSTRALTAADIVDGVIQQSGFNCYNDPLDTPLTVQGGDIVGACIFEPSDGVGFSRRQLDIVGDVDGETLLGMDDSGCTRDRIPSNISTSLLSSRTSRRLHLYANIERSVPAATVATPTTISSTSVANAEIALTTDAGLTTDSGPTSDAGLTTDARLTSDAGLTTDSGPTSDAGARLTSDAGLTTDTALTTDTGLITDTRFTTEVGLTTDNDLTTDAGLSNDTGLTTEAPIVNSQTTAPTTEDVLLITTIPSNVQGTTMKDGTSTDTMTDKLILTSSTEGSVKSSPPDTSRSESDGVSLGTIVGLLVGILLLFSLATIIVIAVVYVAKRKGTSKRYSTANADKISHGFDNVMYICGERLVDGRNSSNMGPDVYEMPVSTEQCGRAVQCHEYELTRCHAAPYEYATFGPNEELLADSSENYYSPLDAAAISFSKLLEKNKQEDIYGGVEEFLQPASEENELYGQLKASGIQNIPSNLIQIKGHLGSGQFGSVEQGLWRDGANSVLVALKLLKEGSTKIDKTKFLQEAAIMAQFRHPNVVKLYGVVSKSEPLMLVVEFIHKGDLRNYLHTLRPDPGELPAIDIPNLLLTFSQQVALGMQYLSAKGFVHRDLAARNILVSEDNICKVADFGMSRDLADETYYVSHGGMIPVKWTAPEAIHYKKYSTASDVWSYGCLLYEIWSLGYKPFDGVTNATVIQLVDSGRRLSPPPGCSRVIYMLMIKCWNPVASQRPSFRQILLSLLGTPETVLSIPKEDLGTHHLAGVLGSPLEAGKNMYRDLHERYDSYCQRVD